MYAGKDIDATQTGEEIPTTTAGSRVCVNLGAADEEDSDDVMDNADNDHGEQHLIELDDNNKSS